MSFCRKMSFKLFVKTSAVLMTLTITTSVGVFAQSENQSARRNSPFSPNPKKRIEAPGTALQNSEPVKTVQNIESGGSIETGVETAALQNENSQDVQNQNQNFNDRSIAKKTYEVAKRASEANVSPAEIYKIGIGDILFIGLQNAPSKETNYFTVLQDGTIDYPLAGEMVSVTGLTTEETEDLLKEKIKLYENPQVSVKVREYNSHAYTVLGMVEKSGEKFLQREAVPLFVVRAEAMVEPKADRAIIKRKNSDEQTVDLKEQKSAETLVFPGDIVEFVAGESTKTSEKAAETAQFYYIGGEIVAGGQKDFHQGLTLTRAIFASGGLKNPKTKKVIIRRRNENGMLTPMEVNLKAVNDGKAIDPAIFIGDTIEIGN